MARLSVFPKHCSSLRMEDGFVDEEAAARIWMMGKETSTKSEAKA